MSKKMQNISLIGMPGSGKTSVGAKLASKLNLIFIDRDHLIESITSKSIQSILDNEGYLSLRAKEEKVILGCGLDGAVLATGGSAVYSDKAMEYLNKNSIVIYLDIPINIVMQRVGDYSNRGFAEASGKSPEDVFNQRTGLYDKWSHLKIDALKDLDTVLDNIILAI